MCIGCKDYWYEYHRGLPQEGYDYNSNNISKVKDMSILEKAALVSHEMNEYRKTIFEFNHDDKNFKCFREKIHPKEDGLYLTIRCGLGGIYTVLNEWQDGQWKLKILDGSTTIAFDPTPVVLNSMEILKT